MAKKPGSPADAGAFERDFGYLLPFLDKVAAAASGLQDAAAREELTRLMAEEKVRWQRIRELLGGAGARAAAPAPAQPTDGAPSLARASADNIHRVAPTAAGLTVGSLKGAR
ncbi:hypothetical protein [Myxococcus sp. RHSTA-1-4]|uniref:hypothetical protein n=1 Tax=Myxococcus sp. RHSTA-1-4 TaxID=2874601 RepID=UPI001CBACCBC|nr:hypothetical protein [Myxococcus sp. RHSTA-1-4]MBZ4417222.1 hypothetical protein [Myxococcus sp. RHSTA-1-4]